MKVYHILTHTVEPANGQLVDKGGFFRLDTHVNKLIRNLIRYDKRGEFDHTMVVLTNAIGKDNGTAQHEDGYPLALVRNSFTIFRDPLQFSLPLIKFVSNIDKESIVHVHGVSSYLFDEIAPLLSKKRSVAHYRGGQFTWRSAPVSFPKYYIFAHYSFNQPRLWFIQNRPTIERFHGMYGVPREKMVHLHNGIEIESFSGNKKKIEEWKARLPQDCVKMLFVGRIVRGKGVIELLDAFREIRKKINACLVIVGDGPLSGIFDGIEGVVNVGRVGEEDKIAIYRACDILVLPTQADSYPNVIAEAMACGLPVISTLTDGAPELVDDTVTGFLVKVGDVEALASRMVLLAGDEELRERMGKAGKGRAFQEFRWEDKCKVVFDKYRYLGDVKI